jgi:hypothetical protein
MSDIAYVSIHGLVIYPLVDWDDTPAPSGSGRKIDNFSVSGMDRATIQESGWEPETYTFQIASITRADVERARKEFNTAPPGAEFCPFNEDQVSYIEYAHAAPTKSTIIKDGQIYYSDVKVVCGNGKLYGTEQGIKYARDVSLPVPATIENTGSHESGLDQILASGGYVAGVYTGGLGYSIDDEEVLLCAAMMRGDRFVLDRFGNCRHSYETKFPKTYAQHQIDLRGNTFFDYGTGGSLAYQALRLGANAKLMVPFHGPLLLSSVPYMEVDVSDIIGAPAIDIAYASDLSDIAAIDSDPLVVGKNEIYFPNEAIGATFVSVGITTGATDGVTISKFRAQVDRYISKNYIPVIDPDDTATLTIFDEEGSNHLLTYLQATYRDIV